MDEQELSEELVHAKGRYPSRRPPPSGHLYKDPPKSPEGLALQAEHNTHTSY